MTRVRVYLGPGRPVYSGRKWTSANLYNKNDNNIYIMPPRRVYLCPHGSAVAAACHGRTLMKT